MKLLVARNAHASRNSRRVRSVITTIRGSQRSSTVAGSSGDHIQQKSKEYNEREIVLMKLLIAPKLIRMHALSNPRGENERTRN